NRTFTTPSIRLWYQQTRKTRSRGCETGGQVRSDKRIQQGLYRSTVLRHRDQRPVRQTTPIYFTGGDKATDQGTIRRGTRITTPGVSDRLLGHRHESKWVHQRGNGGDVPAAPHSGEYCF